MDQFREIPLTEIQWPDPIREEIRPEDIKKMAKSFSATGQILPIVVQCIGPHKYHGIVGRLRYLGAEAAKVPSLMARIHGFTDESEKRVWQLVENLVRVDLNPIARADAMDRLKASYEKELGMSPEAAKEPIVESMRKEIAEVSDEEVPSAKTLYAYLNMAKSFPDDIKKLLRVLPRENFGKRHAEQLLRLKR